MTPCEIDAKLAEAIGRTPTNTPRWYRGTSGGYLGPEFYSAPSWKTSGLLIEAFAQRDWPETSRDKFDRWLFNQFYPSSLTPERIAEAARLAFGIEAPTETFGA